MARKGKVSKGKQISQPQAFQAVSSCRCLYIKCCGQDKEVAGIIENVYSKFKLMLIKKDEASKQSLVAQLTRINSHLENKGVRFLTGDTMCCFDCELMPKLQHIRIAGKNFADFDIPTSLKALWK